MTIASAGHRRMFSSTFPSSPGPMSWITAGTAVIRNSSTASTTTAPTVRTRPFTRFVTNVRSLT